MNSSVYRTRYPTTAASGVPDQYADGIAARAWRQYIGGASHRTSQYRGWLTGRLLSSAIPYSGLASSFGG